MTFDKDYLQPFPNEVRFIYVHVVDVIFGYTSSPKSRFSQIMRKTSIKCILISLLAIQLEKLAPN